MNSERSWRVWFARDALLMLIVLGKLVHLVLAQLGELGNLGLRESAFEQAQCGGFTLLAPPLYSSFLSSFLPPLYPTFFQTFL